MKKAIFSSLLLLALLSVSAQEENIKKGWNFGILPAITFSTDLGFQYGGLIDLYNYGPGDIYPEYYHKFYLEVSRFTKGSGIYRFNYDSEHLIPGIRISSDLSYLPDEAYDFYGFNGYDAVINKSWIDDKSPDYKTRMFYMHRRTLLRFKNDFQGKLSGENLRWNAGFAIQNFKISEVDLEKLNKGKDPEDMLPDVPGLYQLYQEWRVISPDEADGGLINTIKAGITYDTRDNRPNPNKGIWTEGGIETSQKFLGSEATFGKFYLTHRQYFPIKYDKLTFAYRLGYQQTIFGQVPFYYQSQMIVSVLLGATMEGLGGSKSVRGLWRNRVIGDGFVYGNAELRWKAVRFKFIRQNFYLGVNVFSDFGMVTDKIKFDVPNLSEWSSYTTADFFKENAEKLHVTAGAGLKVVMNENFIVAIDLGQPFNEQDGGTGFYMGLNYLF
ncbi:MAG TPA: BamA/TamA family outer membrane protein [Bacteroidales bacterium]|nr:BamA/TamA family outer membrane protein [Bacteroidales bacterium]